MPRQGGHGESRIVLQTGPPADGGKVAVLLANTQAMAADSKNPPRRWLWYALAGGFLIVVISCAGLIGSYRIWRTRQQAQQREAVTAVLALGGTAQQTLSSTSPISVLMEQGDAPNHITLNELALEDDDLRLFGSAPTTRGLFLFKNEITDQGLVHLRDLKSLETLDLRRNTRITDAGLVHLEGLTNLKHLYLIGTGVTPAGAAKLQKKLPKTKIAY